MTKTILRAASLAALVAGAMTFGAAAFAAGCPADKMVADGKGQMDQKMEAKDVTDTVLASTDLSQEMVALGDHQFRLRRLEVQPGGIVPWHSHGDRPAMIYIVQGEMVCTPDSGEPFTLSEGDSCTFPKGWAGAWDVKRPIRKLYTVWTNES